MPPHLIKRKGSSSWYIADGRKKISLHTSRKKEAEYLLEEYRKKRIGIYATPHQRVSQLTAGYLDYCRRLNKPASVEDKERVLRFFVAQTKDAFIGKITGKTVLEYLSWRQDRGLSSERWNTERQVLSNFFRWLQGERILQQNPASGVPKQKIVKKKIPKVLSLEGERTLLDFLTEHDEELRRMAVLVGNTGIRVREVANLMWPDIHPREQSLYVTAKDDWSPKDYEERVIPLNEAALKALREQKEEANGGPYVFPRKDGRKYGRGLDLRMCRAFHDAGLPRPGGFHCLRHTFATRAMEGGMDIETLRKIMGHADTKTLMKYTHVSESHVREMARKIKFG